jgi:hypothetical protein
VGTNTASLFLGDPRCRAQARSDVFRCAVFLCFSEEYACGLIQRGKIYRTCQREKSSKSRLDKAILLLFHGKCGCSGHEIIGDPCGEETADHEKGVSTSFEVKSSEN